MVNLAGQHAVAQGRLPGEDRLKWLPGGSIHVNPEHIGAGNAGVRTPITLRDAPGSVRRALAATTDDVLPGSF